MGAARSEKAPHFKEKGLVEKLTRLFLASAPFVFVLGLGLFIIGGIVFDDYSSRIIGIILVGIGLSGVLESYFRTNGV